MASYKLRRLIPDPIKSVARQLSYLTIFSDVRSLVRFYRVNHLDRGPREVRGAIELRIRHLNGRPISIRAGTKDADVVFNTFVHQFHLPPRNLPARQVKVILDLGANIGCTMAHLAGRYPQATVIGVELDSDNASMGRRNIAPWGGRCRLIEGAIWPYDGEVQYDRVVGAEDGFRVCTGSDGQGGRMTTARSISLSTLVREWCPPGQAIDYMKMDIEGAERGVLQTNTGWSDRVRCIKVELHRYSPEECEADLGRLGFRTWHDVEHPACVIGMKSI